MTTIILSVTVITLPTLLFTRCEHCGKRNLISRKNCKKCNSQLEQKFVPLVDQNSNNKN